MDVDPLADNAPPRYAIESDEEDEYNPLQESSPAGALSPLPDIKLVGDISLDRPLILASGNAGKYWAKGCSLGEQTGAVYVDETQVGLMYRPSWTRSTIIISETFARLPVVYMHSYAAKLIKELKPSRVALLDTYPTPNYVSPYPIPLLDAPIRYLSTYDASDAIASSAERFSPPNFIHSTTSAALLAYIASSSSLVESTSLDSELRATLLLLPFPRIPSPAPKLLGKSDFSHLSEDEYEWSRDMMNTVHRLLLVEVGEGLDETTRWKLPVDVGGKTSVDVPAMRAKVVVDDGMYI
ncbi:hypothetical protein F5878DRAFT_616356 [Lentinula raphanica]|uniref:Uncharacterized protein n=1 Tax=Lentinula raphanica TaxID=153919 RepID=A0AA38UFP0_9AGAR|nr:hypothetical protein F5878DRAFT_616356 [Lentinula raphanica]